MKKNIEKEILNVFEIPEKHPTANDIFNKLKDSDKPTKKELNEVLKHLLKHKQIYKIRSLDNQIHYGKQKAEHFHYICEECGQVRDFLLEIGAENMLKAYIEKQLHSFGKIDKINLSIQGTCFGCSSKK